MSVNGCLNHFSFLFRSGKRLDSVKNPENHPFNRGPWYSKNQKNMWDNDNNILWDKCFSDEKKLMENSYSYQKKKEKRRREGYDRYLYKIDI